MGPGWRRAMSYFTSKDTPPAQRSYAYDVSGNRTSVTDSAVAFYYWYDATDALIKKDIFLDGHTACG